ncbi:17388_t:CDS:2, partial [Acaulospora colombiana]
GIERAHLEGNRLEKRLEKLAKLYATQMKPANGTQVGLKPPLTLKHRRRASEQLIVKWEEDASVTKCPLCEDTNDHAKDVDDDDVSSPEAILASFTNGRARTISTSSTKSLKGEEKLQQQLMVLLEQEELVQGYIHEATRKRKFDDARTLRISLDELKTEIDKIKKELGDYL